MMDRRYFEILIKPNFTVKNGKDVLINLLFKNAINECAVNKIDRFIEMNVLSENQINCRNKSAAKKLDEFAGIKVLPRN